MTKFVPSDFRANFRGRPLTIRSIRTVPAQRRAVLVLDRSASMGGLRKWRVATAAVRAIVAASPGEVTIALIAIGDEVQVAVNFGGSHADVANALASYASNRDFPKGRTSLVDGVSKALELLQPARVGDTIYAVTDGADNRSMKTFDQIRPALDASRVRLAAILVVDGSPRTEEERSGPVELADITRETGGWNILVDGNNTQERIDAITKGIGVLASYAGIIIQLELPEPVEKWGVWHLDLVDDQGHKRKYLKLNYPRKLGPCNP
jgi:Mg-chelatase subunit ChlD